MDYEKAYKAALNTATQWIKDGCTDKERICLEHIFPELRENEDERIRKELIAAIDEGRVFDIDKEVADRWTAYLEKQKEQKPVEWNKKPCLTCQDYKKGFEAGRLEGVTAGYNKAVKEMEQKPAGVWRPSEEQWEVDLKEETKTWVNLMVGVSFPEQDGDFISEEDYRSVIRQTALHFYELGKNSK